MALIASRRPHSTHRARWWGVVLLGVLVVAILVVSSHMLAYIWQPWLSGLPAPTWDGVPAALSESMRSPLYGEGQANPGHPATHGATSDTQRVAHAYHAVVDLLRSLTPKQVDAIQKHVLSFTSLSPVQRQTLIQAADALGKEDIRRHADRSIIMVSDFTAVARDRGPVYLFTWAAPHTRNLCYGLWISFPARRSTAFPGRPVFVQ